MKKVTSSAAIISAAVMAFSVANAGQKGVEGAKESKVEPIPLPSKAEKVQGHKFSKESTVTEKGGKMEGVQAPSKSSKVEQIKVESGKKNPY